MVGAFSALIDAIGLASKIDDNSSMGELTKALNGTKSITERARRSIFIYPVLFSSGMSDIDKDFDIAKFLEIQYGIFTFMTVGLNPSIENGDIAEYLKTVSAEDFENVSIKMKPCDPNQIESWYNMFSEENKDFFEEYKFGTEAKGNRNPPPQQSNQNSQPSPGIPLTADSKVFLDETVNSMNNAANKAEKASDAITRERMKSEKSEAVGTDPFDISEADISASASEKIVDRISKAGPTVITLDIKIKGYQSSFKIPIALKASPHFLRGQDLSALFDSAVEDKRLLTRIVKLNSGEISFFKDFLFNMDRIKRDQNLYKAFGQHPWYQQFTQRKEKNQAKRVGLIASTLAGKGKEILSASSSSNYLPTASIILTQDELEHSAKLKYGFLMKNDKIMWDILNHLGLLCIGVYNADFDVVNFYFNGFKKPLMMSGKQMKDAKGGDPTEKMTEFMTLMVKRGLM